MKPFVLKPLSVVLSEMYQAIVGLLWSAFLFQVNAWCIAPKVHAFVLSRETRLSSSMGKSNQIDSVHFKRLLVSGPSQRGVVKHNLLCMLDEALISLKKISMETTNPVHSHLFSVLCNLFVALDIFSVTLTGVENMQFSHVTVFDLDGKASPSFIDAFMELKNKECSGILPSFGGIKKSFPLYQVWSTYKHQGLGDVALLHREGTLMLKLGEVEVPFKEFEEYIEAAKCLISMAHL